MVSGSLEAKYLSQELTPMTLRENVIAGTDCGLGGRVHSQIAWAKLRALRDGAALASKKLWS